jgi:hypothetical protein
MPSMNFNIPFTGLTGANVISGAKRAGLRAGSLAMGAMSQHPGIRKATQRAFTSQLGALGKAAGYGAAAGFVGGASIHAARQMSQGRTPTLGGTVLGGAKGAAFGAVAGAGGYGAYRLGRGDNQTFANWQQQSAWQDSLWKASRLGNDQTPI